MGDRVAIINHGLSNLNSIARALEECGGAVTVTRDPADLRQADRIVLPGVGSFAAAMGNLRQAGFDDALREEVARRAVPVLGICLGMQLMAESSTEGGASTGLALIPGTVARLEATGEERIPHMGWNAVAPAGDCPLFRGIAPGTDFYFVHSYHFRCAPEAVAATTTFCGSFVSAVCKDNVMAVQFHPEKSQRAGFQLLRNFLAV